MSKPRTLGFLLLGCVAMLAPTCPEQVRPPRPDARAFSTTPGSCDGITDYGDELQVTYLQTASMSFLGFGVIEVDIDVEVQNVGNAHFAAASLLPDLLNAADLGVLTSPAPLAAEFGSIDPGETLRSTVPLRLQIPAAHYGDLIQQLGDGTIPLDVYADEQNVLAPGVEVHHWTRTEDRMYYLASQLHGFGPPPNPDPGPGPFDPGQEFVVSFLDHPADYTPSVFEEYQPGDVFYLVEDPSDPLLDGPLVNIPDAYDRVRVVDLVGVNEEGDGFTLWTATLKRTDEESLPEIYSTASFCTGTSTHIDPPVQATRTVSLDGDVQGDETRDGHEQPLRVNELTFSDGIVTFSGQIAGHVLKPSLSLRLREGHVETGVDFDTDISFTAEVRAEYETELVPEDVPLWSHCFPLPSIPAGPVSIPMNLQLSHSVGLEASLAAGAAVGFQKHFESGFSITCQGGPGVPEDCSSEGHRNPTPIEFTPPHLTDETGASMRVETTLEALLRIGSAYPICDAGPGASLTTTAYGELSVTPTLDPWWSSEYGLEVDAAVEIGLFGLDVARYETDVASWVDGASSAETLVARGAGPAGPRSSGDDQRWAVAIDDTVAPNGVSASKIAALPDGSSVAIASEAVGGRTPLVKLDRYGAMEWVKEFAAGKVPQRVRALSDGSLIVVGTNSWLARVDPDGNLLWSFDAEISRQSFASARCVLYDVAPLETSPGHYDFVAVGRMGNTVVTNYDACALRVDEDGTLAWARLYASGGVQIFNGVTPMQGGDVMVVGKDYWYFAGTRSIPLFVRLDPATGDVRWWKGLPMTRLAELNAVTEAADGTLFATGSTSGIIYTTGTSIVARIAPDGSDARHAEIYQDEAWEALLDFETWTDTAGGDTPYDAYFDIAPSGDGFVVTGGTGLGVETAARVAKINANLGTEWVTTFDGAETDALTGVAPATDGIFASGYSASLPEADGGSGENQLWVMKLPFTGSLDLLPEIALTTRFVAPAVRDSTLDPAVNPTDAPTIDNPYAVEDAVVVSSGPNAGLLVTASPYCVELLTESGHSTPIDACPDP